MHGELFLEYVECIKVCFRDNGSALNDSSTSPLSQDLNRRIHEDCFRVCTLTKIK